MKPLKIFAFVLIATFMASCIKSDDDATGVGDVILVTKKMGNNTVYGVSLYAYSFSSFQSVNAVTTGEPVKTYTLKANQGYKTNFYFETPDADFASAMPEATTYNFSAVFENGATDEFQDVLTDKALTPPVIDTCEYRTTSHLLKINWTTVANADSYAFNLLDGNEVIFGSTELANTSKTYSVTATGTGWASGFTPVSGKTYTLKLFAFLYEPNGDSYNVQATSVSDTTFVWGD